VRKNYCPCLRHVSRSRREGRRRGEVFACDFDEARDMDAASSARWMSFYSRLKDMAGLGKAEVRELAAVGLRANHIVPNPGTLGDEELVEILRGAREAEAALRAPEERLLDKEVRLQRRAVWLSVSDSRLRDACVWRFRACVVVMCPSCVLFVVAASQCIGTMCMWLVGWVCAFCCCCCCCCWLVV
jgi:hypothetical protein